MKNVCLKNDGQTAGLGKRQDRAKNRSAPTALSPVPSFLSRISMDQQSAILFYRFCPSVSLFVCRTLVLYLNQLIYRQTFSTSDRGIILVQYYHHYKIPRGAPALNTWGAEILRFSTENEFYIRSLLRNLFDRIQTKTQKSTYLGNCSR